MVRNLSGVSSQTAQREKVSLHQKACVLRTEKPRMRREGRKRNTDQRNKSWKPLRFGKRHNPTGEAQVAQWLNKKKKKICLQCRRHRFNSWVRRSPGEESSNPLQYFSLGNPMDRGAWWAPVHGVTKSQTRLSDETTPNKPTDSEDEQTQTGQA